MNSVKNNRYNKKLQYRKHLGYAKMEKYASVKASSIATFFALGFFFKFATDSNPSSLYAGFNVGVLVAYFYLQIKLLPDIFYGKTKAYFKREYHFAHTLGVFEGKIVEAAIGMLLASVVFYVGRARLWGDSESIGILIKSFLNPIGYVAGLAFAAAIHYILFYQEKYVLVTEYSNLFNAWATKQSHDDLNAHQKVLEKKDKDQQIHEYQGGYYDEAELRKNDFMTDNSSETKNAKSAKEALSDIEVKRTGRQ